MSSKIHKSLSRAQDFIYIATALILIVAALVLLGFSGYEFVTTLGKNPSREISRLLDNLLLVLMLVEILQTVGIFLNLLMHLTPVGRFRT